MIEEIIGEVVKNGLPGVFLGYFLYNDYQDRKAYREMLRGFGEKVQDHETRICVLEEKHDK